MAKPLPEKVYVTENGEGDLFVSADLAEVLDTTTPVLVGTYHLFKERWMDLTPREVAPDNG